MFTLELSEKDLAIIEEIISSRVKFCKNFVSRTVFETKNFILDTNFTHFHERNSLELTNFPKNAQRVKTYSYTTAVFPCLNFPLLFLIRTATTLYSGHIASES